MVIALSLPTVALNESMAAYFAKCEEKLGFVPNVLKAYAFDMAKLESFVAMYNDLMLAPSGLSKLEREMIAVAVSSHNRCFYCLVSHGAAVRQYSGDPILGELIAMNYRAARLSKRQRAMLDFAVKLTVKPWAVEDADREALRRAGFSEREIWDISAVAGFFNMSNRVAKARPICARIPPITPSRVDVAFACNQRHVPPVPAEVWEPKPVAFWIPAFPGMSDYQA